MIKPRVPVYIVTCLVILGLFAAILPGSSARAAGGTFTFKPSADAYINQTSANTNYGSSTSLRIDNSPVLRSYTKFDVKGLNGAAVTSAKLRIYANSSSGAGLTVSNTNSKWDEGTITFSNAPTIDSQLGKVDSVNSGSWSEVDVSARIKNEGTFSFVVQTPGDTAINLAARESGANAPQLIVTTAAAQPTNTLVPSTATASAAPTQPGATVQPTTPAGQPKGDVQPSFPIRAAFYYPWFPEAWTQKGIYPYTNYNPSMGFYSNYDAATIQKHIAAMQYGGIKVGISSWWGQGQHTDTKFAGVLAATAGSNFRWALYYENESQGDPTVTQIKNDLTYIHDKYGGDPSYLRVNGKFVVFVYADGNDGCGMADRWKQANTLGAYVVLKVFSGYANCASQPDSWHQYAPAVASDSQGGYSYTISPGFWLKGNAVRLGRDLNRWVTNVKAMAASSAKWQLVTTFNEWGEGTSVESAQEWASSSGYGQYLDALHNNGGIVPVGVTPTAQPTQPRATSTTQPTQPPSGSKDPIIFFQGDLVSGSSVSRAQKVVALIQKLISQNPGAPVLVASTGDNEQENSPTLSNYQQYFDPTFGTFFHQGIFRQIRGNHDVQDTGHGAAYAQYFGSSAYINYSYNFGGWHFVGLDQLNGSVNNTSLTFLKNDLASNQSACQLVYWHVPTYSSGAAHGDSTGLKALNQVLYDNGVEIQLSGHDHDYQRFYPLNPNGQRDDARGVTTFVDGIGGQDGRSGSKTSVAQAASAVYLDAFPGGEAIGTIMFTLHSSSADYKLYNANDGSVLDQGTVQCRTTSGTVPTQAPTATAQPTSAPTQPLVTPTAAPTQPPATPTAQPTQPPATPTAQPTATSTPQAGTSVLYFAADNAWSGNGPVSVSDALIKDNQGPIQLGGDTVWDQATASQYAAYWTPTYGRISKSRYHPAYGNHDANTPSQYASYWGAQAGANGQFYYSYDLNSQWHVIVLNSLGDTSATGPQVTWLKNDLAANKGKCVIGVYHYPRWSSGSHGNNSSQQNFWGTLANSGADIVLNGHDHDYERFNPLDAGGNYNATGTREFVVGTGGIPEYNTNNHNQNQAKMILNEFGYLKLTLGSGTYSWQFIPTAGGTVADSGTGQCN